LVQRSIHPPSPCHSHAMSVTAECSISKGGIQISSGLAFGVAMFCVTTMSGGLILGTGPFAGKLISEGYIVTSDVSLIFDGAFLMLTWGAVVTAHISGCCGPQLTSLIGMLLALPGFLLFAFLPNPVDVHVILVGYGLIGWGGYMIFVNSFQFALLFPANFGLADGVIAGLFNASGMVFLILNASDLSFKTFFRVYLGMFALVFILVLLFFPSVPYGKGDTARIGSASLRNLKNPCDFSEYRKHARLLVNARFLLFALQFSLATTFSTYLLGLASEPIFEFGKQNSWYATWAVPLISNSVVIFSVPTGAFIKRTGFGLVGLALAVTCMVSTILCFLTTSKVAAFVVLFLLCLMQALMYTIEFVFLHVVLPDNAFTTGLGAVLLVQGCFNLIPWPIFGEVLGEDFNTGLWILLSLSFLLFAFPVRELWCYGIQQQGVKLEHGSEKEKQLEVDNSSSKAKEPTSSDDPACAEAIQAI